MSKRQIILAVALVALALAQVSLAPHFKLLNGIWTEWINFIDIAVAIIALLERRSHNFSWVAAVAGGAFLDFYSVRFFGFWILILLFIVALIKFIVKKYVRLPSYW